MYRINVGGNVNVAVQDLNPKGSKTILFIHGWPLSHKIFEYQFNVLPKYDIRCVGVDLRGYGCSDKPWRGYSYDRLADDLREVIRKLEIRKAVACGFSMGGAVLARYMSRHRGTGICKIVMMGAACPSFPHANGVSVPQVDLLIDAAYRDRPAMLEEFARKCFHNQPSGAYMKWFGDIAFGAAGHSSIRGLLSLRDEDLTSDLACIETPTAIFHGVYDKICPFTMAEEMRSLITGSVIFPFHESGHCLFYEEKERCNQLLLEMMY